MVDLQCPVTASPQLGGGVRVRAIQWAAVYEGAVKVHLLPGVLVSADWVRPRELEAV